MATQADRMAAPLSGRADNPGDASSAPSTWRRCARRETRAHHSSSSPPTGRPGQRRHVKSVGERNEQICAVRVAKGNGPPLANSAADGVVLPFVRLLRVALLVGAIISISQLGPTTSVELCASLKLIKSSKGSTTTLRQAADWQRAPSDIRALSAQLEAEIKFIDLSDKSGEFKRSKRTTRTSKQEDDDEPSGVAAAEKSIIAKSRGEQRELKKHSSGGGGACNTTDRPDCQTAGRRAKRTAAAANKNGADSKSSILRFEMNNNIDNEQLVELLAQFYAHSRRLRDEFELIKRKIEQSIRADESSFSAASNISGPQGSGSSSKTSNQTPSKPQVNSSAAKQDHQQKEAASNKPTHHPNKSNREFFFHEIKMHLGADDESLMKWLRQKQDKFGGSLKNVAFEMLNEPPNRTINVCSDGPKILLLPNVSDILYCYTREQWTERMWSDLRLSSYHYPIIMLNVLIFLFGTTGNIFVCLSVKRNHQLRSVTNYFIVNLAFADFLVILICLPATVVWDLSLTWFFDTIPCKLIMFLQDVSISVSVLTLTAISIDRYYAICHPLKFKSSLNQAKRTIALIWLVSLVTMTPDLIYLSAKRSQDLVEAGLDTVLYSDCNYDWSEQASRSFQFVKTILLYFLPFLLMFCAHYRILKVLRLASSLAQHHQHSQQQQQQLIAIPSDETTKLAQIDRIQWRGSSWLRHCQHLQASHRRRCSLACERRPPPELKQPQQPPQLLPAASELISPAGFQFNRSNVSAKKSNPIEHTDKSAAAAAATSRTEFPKQQAPFPVTDAELTTVGVSIYIPRFPDVSPAGIDSPADSETGTVLELKPATGAAAKVISDGETGPQVIGASSISLDGSETGASGGQPGNDDEDRVRSVGGPSDKRAEQNRAGLSTDEPPQQQQQQPNPSGSGEDSGRLRNALGASDAGLDKRGQQKGGKVNAIFKRLTRFRATPPDQHSNQGQTKLQQSDKQQRRLQRLLLVGSSHDSANGDWRDPPNGAGTGGNNNLNLLHQHNTNGNQAERATRSRRGDKLISGRISPTGSRNGVAKVKRKQISGRCRFAAAIGVRKADDENVKDKFARAREHADGNSDKTRTGLHESNQPRSATVEDSESFNYKPQTSASYHAIHPTELPTSCEHFHSKTVGAGGAGAPVANGGYERMIQRDLSETGAQGGGGGGGIGSSANELADGEGLTLSMHNKSKLESRRKAAKMLTAIVVLFGICYLPVHLINFLRQFIEDIPQTDITSTISMLAHCVCYLNSAINPIIYNHMNSVFRAEFRKFLSCLDWRRTIDTEKPTTAAVGNDNHNNNNNITTTNNNNNPQAKHQFNYPTSKVHCHTHHLSNNNHQSRKVTRSSARDTLNVATTEAREIEQSLATNQDDQESLPVD